MGGRGNKEGKTMFPPIDSTSRWKVQLKPPLVNAQVLELILPQSSIQKAALMIKCD